MEKLILRVWLFFCLFFTASLIASASTYYVSTTGTDDGSHGTSTGTDAWATLDYALTGNRVAKGDTINIEAGTYDSFYGANTSLRPSIDTSTGSGTVTVQAYPDGASVIIDIPSNTSTSSAFFFLNASNWTDLTFKGITFTNSNSVNTSFLWLYGHTITFEDCSISMNSTGKYVFIFANDTEDASLTVRRSTIADTGASLPPFTNARTDSGTATINFESDLLKNFASTMFRFTRPDVITLTNNTFIYDNYYAMLFISSGGTYTIKNNIFYTTSASDWYPIIFGSGGTDHDYFLSNPDKFVVQNNVWYRSTGFLNFVYNVNAGGLLTDDGTNHWIDPSFVDDSNDFSISDGSYICSKGSNDDLPAGGDINGEAWAGNDIGAYKCPSATSPITTLLNKVAFVGDSIMRDNDHNTTFNGATGVDYVDGTNSAISGATMERIFAHLDDVMINYTPNTVILAVGINNLAQVFPANATSQQYADYIVQILQKAEDWGARPIWIGIGSLNNYGGLDDTMIDEINDFVEAECITNIWDCGAYFDQMRENDDWQSASPDGYYDTDGDVHPNSLGQTLIGQFAAGLYDSTSPVVSSVFASPAESGATITWTTNESSSSKIDYGTTDSYGSTTSETDTSPRVTSHTVTLSDLASCTTYHYRVRSIDGPLNEVIDTDNTFTTTGCEGGYFPISYSTGGGGGGSSNNEDESSEESSEDISELSSEITDEANTENLPDENITIKQTTSTKIEIMVNENIITGDAKGLLRLNEKLNRAEASALVSRIISSTEIIPPDKQPFSDVEVDDWFAGYVSNLKTLKIIHGYEDGTYSPEKNINLAEFIKIALETYYLMVDDEEIQAEINTDTYKNLEDDWYTPYIIAATEMGVISGFSCGEEICFDVNKNITRSEAIIILHDMFQSFLE